MQPKRQIYLLDPQQLSPETIAVTFAKTSRSPESFRDIAAELTAASSADFNEKWVVGYGHSSVAEHAVLHIALENVSRLAVENIESNRLASYTEKSTRYQTWEDDAFHLPAELTGHPLEGLFTSACATLFSIYRSCIQAVIAHLKSNSQSQAGESEAQLNRRLRSQAIDACRFLLPAASLANVGVTINARALEHAVGKLLTSPLIEAQQIGAEIRHAASASIPTLLKYADQIPYLQHVCQQFSALSIQVDAAPEPDWCQLIGPQPDVLEKILAAELYREQDMSFTQALKAIRTLPDHQKNTLLRCLLETPDRHTIPSRELEYAFFTFDLLIDQGAYFEVKRHRMMTQTAQLLTARFGYAIPALITEAGMDAAYCAAIDKAREVYEQLADFNPDVAAYIVPNGFNRRVLLHLNLRSLVHFIRLRSAPNAHFSVQRVAQRMAEEISAHFPELSPLLGRNENETSKSIETVFFTNTHVVS